MDKHPLLAGARILIVDDLVEWHEVVRDAFTGTGSDLQAVRDGEAALRALLSAHLAGRPFHLVLLDLMLPQMNGFRTLESIRRTPPLRSTPVIVMTVENKRRDLETCRRFGVSGYLLKPFKRERLLEASEKAVQRGLTEAPGGGT